MTQTEDGGAAAAPCERQIVLERGETGKGADGQGPAETVAGEREVALTDAAEGGGLAGGGSEGLEAAQLDEMMEAREEHTPRAAHDGSRAAEQEGGQQGAPHTAAPCPVPGRFQQAFTDRTIQVASHDTNTAGAEYGGFPLGPAAEETGAAGGGSEQPRSLDEGSGGEGVTPFPMELPPPPGEGLQLRRAPSPYSLRRSTLLRTRQADGEHKKRGAAEGEATGEQKDGQQGGGEGEAKGPARQVAGPSPWGCTLGGSRAPAEIVKVACCMLAGTRIKRGFCLRQAQGRRTERSHSFLSSASSAAVTQCLCHVVCRPALAGGPAEHHAQHRVPGVGPAQPGAGRAVREGPHAERHQPPGQDRAPQGQPQEAAHGREGIGQGLRPSTVFLPFLILGMQFWRRFALFLL